MKYRDSGMPKEEMWDTFFSPDEILSKMEITDNINLLLDIGCGYGTFIIPVSKIIKEKVIGVDIDKEMIDICRKKITDEKIQNIDLLNIDISSEESYDFFGKYNEKIDYISLFNILHCEEPVKLLKCVYKLLNKNGKIGIIHWKYEKTPRGPVMEIRPKPEQIIEWADISGFKIIKKVDLPPYHFGLIFNKI